MIIEFSSDSTKFRSTMIKSYYDDDHLENSSLFISIINFSFIAFISKSLNMSQSNDQFVVFIDQKLKFKNFSNSFKRDRDRFGKYLASTAYLSFVFNTTDDLDLVFAFIFASTSILAFAVVFKFDSIVHIALSQFAAFRQKDIVHIAFSQFAAFRQKEINDFIEKSVFRSINKNDVSFDIRIFNFRFVNEIKHFDINKIFKKSRFVM